LGVAGVGALPVAGQLPDRAAQQEATPEALGAKIETLMCPVVAANADIRNNGKELICAALEGKP
jgi:hypothetical protein